MPTVSVKWQKQVFPSVEIDTSQPPLVFKCQLYDLTGVPPERQKIMVKGGLLKDDADWSTLGIKEGQKLMMMGTADEIVKVPEKGPVFMEDLPEEEQVVAVLSVSSMPKKGSLKTQTPPAGEKDVADHRKPSLEQKKGHEIDEIFPSKKKRKNRLDEVDTPKEKDKEPSLEQKKPTNEIDEIFSSKKKRTKELDEVEIPEENSGSKHKKMKKKKKTKASGSDGFVDPPPRPRKKTNDGLTVYTEDELGIFKSDAGGTPLCPFDCSCCF